MEEATAILEQAQLLVNAKRFDDALRLLAALPEDGAARYLSAVAYLRNDDLKSALANVETTIAMMPDVPEPHALRAEVLLEMGRKKSALQSAREAVRLSPDQAPFHYVLARAAAETRNWTTAETAAHEALRLAPDWGPAHNVVAIVAARRHRRKDAQAHLADALKLDPNDPWVLNNLAATMPRLKPRTEAVKLLESAVELDPANKPIVENLYVTSRAHVAGAGIDRLDIVLGGPTLAVGLLMLAYLTGWIHMLRVLGIASIVIAVPLLIIYSVADYVRNRGRLRNLRSGTRMMYFRRFYRDHWQASLAFVVTLIVPAVLLGTIASAVGLPSIVVALLVLACFPVWLAFWPRIKRIFFLRRFTGSD